MTGIIKHSPVDPNLSRALARLTLANRNLSSAMSSRDFKAILTARATAFSAADAFQEAAALAPESPGNRLTIGIGTAKALEASMLCKEASEGVRLFFEPINGGKS